MNTNDDTVSTNWREVLVAVLKQIWWAALLAAALMIWDYSTAHTKPALATLAKDSFLTFSFLMFFGNLWQRTRKQVEDRAELKSIRDGVATVQELLLELQNLGLQVPGPVQAGAQVFPPSVTVTPVAAAEPEVYYGNDSAHPQTISYVDEPAAAVKLRVLQELPTSPLAALIHTAIAIEGQLRRVAGNGDSRKENSPVALLKKLRDTNKIEPTLYKWVSRFLQLRNAAVHEPFTSEELFTEAVYMGIKILQQLEPLPDHSR